MAKFMCKCGTTTRDDDPDHGLLMFRSRDYEDDAVVGLSDLLGRCMQVIDCPTCGRLWVWWERQAGAAPVEYTRRPPGAD